MSCHPLNSSPSQTSPTIVSLSSSVPTSTPSLNTPTIVPSPQEQVPSTPPRSRFKKFWEWEPTAKTKKKWWWRFVKKSKCPGIKEAVAEDTHVTLRIFWILATLACLGGGIYWMYLAGAKQKPTFRNINLETLPTSRVPFAITIEKMNSVTGNGLSEMAIMRKKFGQEDTIEHNENVWTEVEFQALNFFLSQLCTPTNKLSGWFDDDDVPIPSDNPFEKDVDDVWFYDDPKGQDFSNKVARLIRKVTIPCSEMYAACTWNYRKVDCDTLFYDAYTESGAMCSFNAMPIDLVQKHASIVTTLNNRNMTIGELEAWRNLTEIEQYLLPVNISEAEFGRKVFSIPDAQQNSGQEWGLRTVLVFNRNEIHCKQPDVFAYRAVVHLPTRLGNPRSRGFTIPPNHEVTVHIIPVMNSASEDTRSGSSPINRQCYFKSETVNLKRYAIYTFENCEEECVADKVEEKCKCTHLYYPRLPTNQTRICVSREDMKCIHSVELSVFGKSGKGGCSDCLPNCNTGTFQTIITSVAYPQDDPPEYIKLLDLDPDTPTAVLRAAIDESRIPETEDNMKRDPEEKLASVTGILGTTNGLTVLDILKMLVASVALTVPIKTVLDLLVFYLKRKMTPRQARKVEASVFEELVKINAALIRIGQNATTTGSSTDQSEGGASGTTQRVERIDFDNLPPLLKIYLNEHSPTPHWTDYAEPKDPETMSVDRVNYRSNRGSRRPLPPFNERETQLRLRGSAPARLNSSIYVTHTQPEVPVILPNPAPTMDHFLQWYVNRCLSIIEEDEAQRMRVGDTELVTSTEETLYDRSQNSPQPSTSAAVIENESTMRKRMNLRTVASTFILVQPAKKTGDVVV